MHAAPAISSRCGSSHQVRLEASTRPLLAHDLNKSWHTRQMRRKLTHMTVAQAQALQAVSPGQWQLCETREGWVAKKGSAVLVATNGGHVRRFASADTAIRRLQAEVGVTRFEVEALSA